MIDREYIITDNRTDEIGVLLEGLRKASPGQSREKAREALRELATSLGYVFFVGNCNRYSLHRLCESYLYHVPLNKRGNLRDFRGQLVRICCWHAGNQFERNLMAGVVEEDQYAGPHILDPSIQYNTTPTTDSLCSSGHIYEKE